MGSPYKYQSSWLTEEPCYTKSETNTLISNYYGYIPVLASAPDPALSREYINSGDNNLYIYYGDAWQVIHKLNTITSAPVFIETGNPMGLLLSLTYQT